MNDIQNAILTLLPPKRKATPSGWTSFNAPCCHHRGETRDNRQRGGILTNTDGGFQYHCFNCNFKAGWQPGKLLTKNTRQLLSWLGLDSNEIARLNLAAMKSQDNNSQTIKKISFELEEKSLPEQCKSIQEWILEENNDQDLISVINYIVQRGMQFDWYNWHWSSANGYRDRLIIPFYHDNKIVGWTGRKVKEGKPKYLTESQPGYVFNLSAQPQNRQYLVVVEGQLDAIAIDGVAIMHNEPNETQISRLKIQGKEIIVVPDRDRAGAKMIKPAIENDWAVSIPPWEDDIKDLADAVKRYGRIYALWSIINYRETNKIKLQLLEKRLQNNE